MNTNLANGRSRERERERGNVIIPGAIPRRETGGGQSQTQGGHIEFLRVDDPTKPLLNFQ